MLTRTWTGVIRARFAGSGKPWMWRTLHAAAYLAWPLGITHGLTAGRPAKTWVTLSYMGCVLFVLIGLLRLVTGEDDERPFRRSRSARHRRDEDDNVDPGYGRPYPYVLAVDPAPSRRARPGRRAAGGQELDDGGVGKLVVDWSRCDGRGLCAHLLPELIRLDGDGYPVSADMPVPAWLEADARRAVDMCPALALRPTGFSRLRASSPPAAAARVPGRREEERWYARARSGLPTTAVVGPARHADRRR